MVVWIYHEAGRLGRVGACQWQVAGWALPACWPTIGGAAARTHSHISPHHWGARSGPVLLLGPGLRAGRRDQSRTQSDNIHMDYVIGLVLEGPLFSIVTVQAPGQCYVSSVTNLQPGGVTFPSATTISGQHPSPHCDLFPSSPWDIAGSSPACVSDCPLATRGLQPVATISRGQEAVLAQAGASWRQAAWQSFTSSPSALSAR